MSVGSVQAVGRPAPPAGVDSTSYIVRHHRPESPARVLQVHGFYQQPGGEDAVVAAEHNLLRERGHYVAQYTVSNDALTQLSAPRAAIKTLWNADTVKQIKRSVAEHAP